MNVDAWNVLDQGHAQQSYIDQYPQGQQPQIIVNAVDDAQNQASRPFDDQEMFQQFE